MIYEYEGKTDGKWMKLKQKTKQTGVKEGKRVKLIYGHEKPTKKASLVIFVFF